MKIAFFVCCLLAFWISSCSQVPDPLRNKIEFNAETYQVADSLLRMEELLRKLSPSQVLSSSTDIDGYLFVNGKKMGLLEFATKDSLTRNDPVFKNLLEEDYSEFISLSIFLLKNNIGYSMRDNLSGVFVHGYRETSENSYNDVREIIVNVDVTSVNFLKRYQILDQKENLVLVAPIDAKVKR